MIALGESLVTGTTTFSPWFERFGNAATFACEVMALVDDVEVQIGVQTKNPEDTDDSAETLYPEESGGLDTPWTVDAMGTDVARFTGFKQLVRFQYVVEFAVGPPPATRGVIHFRMLPPIWEDNAVVAFEESRMSFQE